MKHIEKVTVVEKGGIITNLNLIGNMIEPMDDGYVYFDTTTGKRRARIDNIVSITYGGRKYCWFAEACGWVVGGVTVKLVQDGFESYVSGLSTSSNPMVNLIYKIIGKIGSIGIGLAAKEFVTVATENTVQPVIDISSYCIDTVNELFKQLGDHDETTEIKEVFEEGDNNAKE